MVTPRTGLPFRKRGKDDIRFWPEGYVLGFAEHYRRQGMREHAAFIRAVNEVEGEAVNPEYRYRALHRLGKTRRPYERRWFRLVADALDLAKSGCPEPELIAAAERVDAAAKTNLRLVKPPAKAPAKPRGPDKQAVGLQPHVLRLPSVIQVTGWSRSTVLRKSADGSFVAPIRLGVRSIGWPTHAVMQWLAERPPAHSLPHARLRERAMTVAARDSEANRTPAE